MNWQHKPDRSCNILDNSFPERCIEALCAGSDAYWVADQSRSGKNCDPSRGEFQVDVVEALIGTALVPVGAFHPAVQIGMLAPVVQFHGILCNEVHQRVRLWQRVKAYMSSPIV